MHAVGHAVDAAVGGVGNVLIGTGRHFITPQMRLQLLETARNLRDEERVQLGHLAKQLCPSAVEDAADGREIKIDVDALDPRTFLTLDMHVRRQLGADVKVLRGCCCRATLRRRQKGLLPPRRQKP